MINYIMDVSTLYRNLSLGKTASENEQKRADRHDLNNHFKKTVPNTIIESRNLQYGETLAFCEGAVCAIWAPKTEYCVMLGV